MVHMKILTTVPSEGHLPVSSAKPAIFPYVRVETDFASFFSREGEGKFSSTLVLADMACLARTAKVSNFIITTLGKHAAPVLVCYRLPVFLFCYFILFYFFIILSLLPSLYVIPPDRTAQAVLISSPHSCTNRMSRTF